MSTSVRAAFLVTLVAAVAAAGLVLILAESWTAAAGFLAAGVVAGGIALATKLKI